MDTPNESALSPRNRGKPILNLLSNARHAPLDSGRPDKRLTIRVQPAPDDRLRIQVSDNGKGIAPEHLSRLFTQGFTTKKDGHGVGLHISSLAAIKMAGSLTCDVSLRA